MMGSWGRNGSVSALLAVLLAACGGSGEGGSGAPRDDANLDGPGGDSGRLGDDLDLKPDRGIVDASKKLPDIEPDEDKQKDEETDKDEHGKDEHGKENECKIRKTVAVAVEGQEVPGTAGLRFDRINEYDKLGFDHPQVNKEGNVAFAASYSDSYFNGGNNGGTPPEALIASYGGAGIFFWNRDYDDLSPVALADEMTAAGRLPHYLAQYNGPVLNKQNQIAFSVKRHDYGLSAVFQWSPDTPLVVLADENDYVPGANSNTFWEFGKVDQNKHGDVAFAATYDEGDQNGIFVKRHDEMGLESIVNYGDELPGTRGGTLCGPDYGYKVGGPWINDDGAVVFQANCIYGGTPGLEGSLFIKKPDHELKKLVLIGEELPYEKGTIRKIHVGKPGINDEQVALLLEVADGKAKKVIATRDLSHGKNDKYADLEICAKDEQKLDYGMELNLGYEAPSIAEDGTLTFIAEAKRKDGDAYPIERDTVFTCLEGDVKEIAAEGDRKPVTPWHRFGELADSSSAVKHRVWLDEGKEYDEGPIVVSAEPNGLDFGLGFGKFTGVFADDGLEECVRPKANAIAVEGQVAPGTWGERFDAFYEGYENRTGFAEPLVNEDGNAAFLASYGYNSGAGLFAWNKKKEFLFPVAITDQQTTLGKLPEYIDNYGGIALNDSNQIAFSVRNIETYQSMSYVSAVFRTSFQDPLTVVARTDDPVPDSAGFFDKFLDVALNDDGDLAFIAHYVDFANMLSPYQYGVFLQPHDQSALEAIVLHGETLPETGGGSLCGYIGGPWINDEGTVLFQANCIDGASEYEGSIFMRRRGGPIEALVLRNDHMVEGGWIDDIDIGKFGLADGKLAMKLKVQGGTGERLVIATKKLERDEEIDVCASQGDDLGYDFQLLLDGAPTIGEGGTIAFSGKALNMEYWFKAEAAFVCHKDQAKIVAARGQVKPGWRNTFGELDQVSNADGWVIFVDEKGGDPSGVYSVDVSSKEKKDSN